MKQFQLQLEKADRLHAITQKVGFALWQLQELEGATAQYFVFLVQTKPGMGIEAGQALVDKALSKTFGATIVQLIKAKCLPDRLEVRFQALLAERNWLVHNSRSTSRDAIHSDQACLKLLNRLEAVSDEAHALIKEVVKEVEVFVRKYGIDPSKIEEQTAETLKRWHGEDAL